MAYSDPQRGRDAVRTWRKMNPELVRQQRARALIRRAVKEKRLPRLSSIARHKLGDEELRRIVDAAMCGGPSEPVVTCIRAAVMQHVCAT